MRKIFKYQVVGSPGDTVAVETVPGAVIVHFGMQGGRFFFWAEHEVDREKERFHRRVFCIHGTGWEIEAAAQYRGTVQDGGFVWHLHEMGH